MQLHWDNGTVRTHFLFLRSTKEDGIEHSRRAKRGPVHHVGSELIRLGTGEEGTHGKFKVGRFKFWTLWRCVSMWCKAPFAVLVSVLAAVGLAASALPEQIHIAYAGDTGMAVSWATKGPTATSTVKFGTESSMTHSVTGVAKTYYGNEYHHHVQLLDLQPGTTYYYVCGDSTSGFSETKSFKAPVQATDGVFSTSKPHKISIFGDWGYGDRAHATQTRKALETIKKEVEFIWHVGDLSYADDALLHTPLKFEYENIYDDWMNWIENISDSKPYMVGPGNHESECHSPACIVEWEKRGKPLHNFSAYEARWFMPSGHSGGNSNMWYSFNLGLVHYVMINTETDFPGAAEEKHGDSGILPAGGFGREGEFLKWLEKDLADANANRKVRPWIMVGGHRPIYSDDIVGVLQRTFEDLMLRYKVDIFFAGHRHYATRSWPLQANGTITAKNYINPKGVVHITAGGAGCDEYHAPKQHTLPPFSASRVDQLATGVLTVYNRSMVHFDLIGSADMKVLDKFTLTKEA